MTEQTSLYHLINKYGRVSFSRMAQFARGCESQKAFESFYHVYSLLGIVTHDISERYQRGEKIDSNVFYLFPLIKKQQKDEELFNIGKDLDCDLLIPDVTIEPFHAQIRVRDHEHFIRPMDEHLIEVKGDSVGYEEMALYDGNEITLGRYTFTLLSPQGLFIRLLPDVVIEDDAQDDKTVQSSEEKGTKKSSQEKHQQHKDDVLDASSEITVSSFALYNSKAKSLLSEEERDQVMSYMKKLAIFKQFTAYQLRRLIAFESFIQYFQNREMIIRERDSGDTFYILLEGKAEVTRKGMSKPLWSFSPGEFFGESSFFEGGKRNANVISRGHATVLTFNKEILGFLGVEIREQLKMLMTLQITSRLDAHNKELARYRSSPYYPSQKGIWQGPSLERLPYKKHYNHALSAQNILSFFEHLKIFAAFTQYEKKRFSAMKERIQYFPAGTMIIKQGDMCRDLYIILRGEVSVVYKKSLKKQAPAMILANLSSGKLFGDAAFFSKIARNSSIVAEEKTLVFALNEQLMDQLGPEIREKFYDMIIKHLFKRMRSLNIELTRFRTSLMA
ncbi:cyclic nucleotide-binding domain-containing protein [Magnetococcales bacterium HHB-1]